MRIEDILPALRAGRRARRASWVPGHHIMVDMVGGRRTDRFTLKAGAFETTWPASQVESLSMLAEDWELLASPEFEAYVPKNFREALDIVISMMSKEEFDAYGELRESRSVGPKGLERLKSDCDWRDRGKECLLRFMDAASAASPDTRKELLAKACIASLKALSYMVAEEYMDQVMRG